MNRDVRRLEEALERWAEAERHEVVAPPELELALRARFVAQHARRRTRRRAFGGVAVAALAALVVVSFVVRSEHEPVDPAATPVAERERAAETLLPPPVPASGPDRSFTFAPWGPRHRAHTYESARVVRLRVPASALSSLGLDLALAASGGHVLADAVLAEDGSVRALRPVSYEAGF